MLSKKGDHLKYQPGIIINNDNRVLKFNCGESRALSYYVEYLVLVALFGKGDLKIELQGITNDDIDLGVDGLAQAMNAILTKFGAEPVEIKIKKRGFRPNGKEFHFESNFTRWGFY